MRRLVCSPTADSTLRRAITAASGVKSAAFGSLNSEPKTRVYSASGEVSDGFIALPARLLWVLVGLPVQDTSSERKRLRLPMTSATKTSMLGSGLNACSSVGG